MRNVEVARIFYELADLLEFKGEAVFKIRAYKNAARILASLDRPVEAVWKEGVLTGIPGIGKNIAAKIEEILTTGNLKKHKELLREIPPGLLEIMSLPGIGPKRAAMFHKELDLTSLEELAGAARKAQVRYLPGMGAKTEYDILRNIRMRQNQGASVLLGTAWELAELFGGYLRLLPGVMRVEAGGDLRRRLEVVTGIELVVAAADPEPVMEAAAGHPAVKKTVRERPGRAVFATRWGVTVKVEVVPEKSFAAAWFRNTGSPAHYNRICQLMSGRGISFTPGMPGSFREEEDIYAALEMQFVPPELREDRGEVEAALQGRLPGLVELKELKGDLHLHTDWSDGLNSIEQVVARAREKGYRYVAVTDHSRSLKIAGGLSLDRLREQHRKIRFLNEQLDDFCILTGIEVDILPKGDLDCPDEILSKIDLVVASVHSAFKQDRETMTARILSAIKNKNVHIIGHLTGRLLNHRQGYALDVERVLDAAASCGTILEINSSPDRLDLNDVNARRAKEKGIKLSISTDAHSLKGMDDLRYGVSVARRAWLKPDDVINTMPAGELLRFLKKKKVQ